MCKDEEELAHFHVLMYSLALSSLFSLLEGTTHILYSFVVTGENQRKALALILLTPHLSKVYFVHPIMDFRHHIQLWHFCFFEHSGT